MDNPVKTKPLGMRIGESIFTLSYLIFAYTAGVLFLISAFKDQGIQGQRAYYLILALLCWILAMGDSFHLIPRTIENVRGSLKNRYSVLGLGNLVSSITMTVFYVLLYFPVRFRIPNFIMVSHHMTFTIYRYGNVILAILIILAIVRIVLCLLPFNNWFKEEGSFKWAIIRNIPFLLMGILIVSFICYYYSHCAAHFSSFGFIPAGNMDRLRIFPASVILITLSFLFYIPVALFARRRPALGMLMLPKTICYILLILFWLIW